MDKKTLIVYGAILIGLQIIMGLKVFVTFSDMAAYAVSKDNMQLVIERLDRIETKIDKAIGH